MLQQYHVVACRGAWKWSASSSDRFIPEERGSLQMNRILCRSIQKLSMKQCCCVRSRITQSFLTSCSWLLPSSLRLNVATGLIPHEVTYEVVAAAKIQVQVFWVLTLCDVVGGPCCHEDGGSMTFQTQDSNHQQTALVYEHSTAVSLIERYWKCDTRVN